MKFLTKIKKIRALPFLFLGLVIFSFLFLPTPIYAWDPLGIINAVLSLPVLLIAAFLGLLVTIAAVYASIASHILDWVLRPSFISYSYTNPAGPYANPIIEAGLSITQGLVNMFLVVALIYIALAIALKLAVETEAKKMLAKLILVAY